MKGLHERQVVQFLLVRAAEEKSPALFPPEVISDAALSALDARDDLELLDKRSAYLLLRLPRTLKALAHAALLPEDRIGPWVALAVLAGMLSNYLGPSGQVHIAYNPLTFLLAWNITVFSALAWRRVRRKPAVSSVGVARPLVVEAYERWIAFRARQAGGREHLPDAAGVATAFTRSYWNAAAPVLLARLQTLVHLAAIGVLAGALVGTYLRGLFFEYNAVWRSTFLTEPSSVATFLNLLLGPASLLIDGRFLDAASIAPLLAPTGDTAGPWIHKLALASTLVIAVPRFVLATLAARQARAAARSIEVDFSEPYYVERIASVREGLGHRLRDEIATTFRLEVGKLSESVAVFVGERFFDKIVAPTLVTFRNRGGRVCDLEAELAEATSRFEPALSAFLTTGQQALQQSLAAGVRTVIGRELRPASDVLAASSPTSLPLEQGVTSSVATSVGDALGATVTAAVTAAVATVSGGVGKTLGVAVLSSLLGTSGPIGLLIGGAAALALVGGAYLFGRDRIAGMIKTWSMPASVASLALRDAKIEEAREATTRQVRRDIRENLEPRIAEVTEAILHQLPLVVAASAAKKRA